MPGNAGLFYWLKTMKKNNNSIKVPAILYTSLSGQSILIMKSMPMPISQMTGNIQINAYPNPHGPPSEASILTI
jgi:hypothetical protein